MSGSDTAATIERLLDIYRRAHYGVVLADRSAAILQVGAALPPAVGDWLGDSAWAAYLTACNPCSRPLDARENARRMDALRRRLRDAGLRILEGAGVSSGDAWSEPSLLVAGLAPAALDPLARALQQNAVLTVAAGAAPRLRLYRGDWRAHLGTPADINWA